MAQPGSARHGMQQMLQHFQYEAKTEKPAEPQPDVRLSHIDTEKTIEMEAVNHPASHLGKTRRESSRLFL